VVAYQTIAEVVAQGNLGLGPDVSVACELEAAALQWLPDQENRPIGWGI
jgi:hypothetical protein